MPEYFNVEKSRYQISNPIKKEENKLISVVKNNSNEVNY